MSGQEQAAAREILEKAYEKLLPAFGYLLSGQAGFIATVVVFTTWLLRRSRPLAVQVNIGIERDEETLIRLKKQLDEVEARLSSQKAAYEKADPWEKERIGRNISLLERERESLKELYGLVELRIAAVKRLQRLGETGALKNALKIAKMIEDDKLMDAQYKIMKTLEKEWEKRQVNADLLRRILETV